MKRNEPVTGRAYVLRDDATLMSTTDTRGHIQYANAAFIEASGFSREELQGQPHNIVRHPDMPAEAFADMWASLKAGLPWTALVKNRRQDGDHYWVRANASPVIRQGQTVGYLSVRTKPTDAETQQAEALYKDLREGRAGQRRIHKGLLIRTGAMAWRSALQTMPVRWRIRWGLIATWPALMLTSALLGLDGMHLLTLGTALAIFQGLCGWWLEAQIARPLEQLRHQSLQVATGASHQVQHLDRVDEIGMTLRSVSQLGLMLRWLVDDVAQQVLTVQSASSEIAAGNNDLSHRTEQAASSVQETSATMSHMSTMLHGHAQTAQQANQLSSSATEAARAGGQAMSEVVSTMADITQSSHKISDIIGVIDGIAFQTNILALNAAVEAARAGEQGRGFAVVAGEVRSLAQRSAEAAREIKSLIHNSVERVTSGARLVDGAGQAMDTLQTQVQRVSDLIAEISAATTDQSGNIAVIGESVNRIDEITQQNAALVEQSAAASESLRQQAARLAEAISVFR